MCTLGSTSAYLKERNPVFDVVKALMMLWVIWGHLSLYNVIEPVTSVYMLNAKIGINMPVFFVIGGLLAASTFERANWSKLIARTISFMWPQVAVAILYGVGIALAGGDGAFSWVMRMWFLRAYAIVYILSAIVFRCADTDKKRWLIFLILYVAMLFWPSRFRIGLFAQVIHMFPYFVFGLMCLRKKALSLDWRVGCSCGMLFLAAVFLQGDSGVNGMNFWKVNAHWKVVLFNRHELFTFFARTVVGVCGSIFALFAVGSLMRVMPSLSWLSKFGMTSLGIYVIHEYPLYVAGSCLPILPLPSWSRWIVALVVFLMCHFVVVVVKRFSITRFAFFGNEKMLADGLRRFSGRLVVSG